MVDGQLRPNRVTNAALLAAIGELPRERFLPDALKSVAYADDDVPLGSGRYMMEPMVLARLIQSLQPQPEDQALVAASGRGYGVAILARLVGSVVAVENNADLAASNRKLVVAAGTGATTFTNIGSAQALADLDITAATINSDQDDQQNQAARAAATPPTGPPGSKAPT